MKTWNLGNTTVRNPWRIREGLRVLQELFEGQYWTPEGQALYYRTLVDRHLIEPEGELPSVQTQGINGRKWAAAPNQLGLARAWARRASGSVQITPAGRALLAADDERLQQEVWLRQMLKYKLPSPLEHGTEYDGFDVMPYRLTLKVVHGLHRRGLRGITKEEIALFLITAIRNSDVDETVRRVLEYREERNKRVGLVAKRAFFREQRARRVRELFAADFKEEYALLRRAVRAHRSGDRRATQELLSEVAAGGKGGQTKQAQTFLRESIRILRAGDGFDELREIFDTMRLSVRGGTLWDYADTTVRYSAITGIFSLSGDKMVLVEERLPLIEHLVAEGFPVTADTRYLPYLHADNAPLLPTDDEAFLRTFVAGLEKRREGLRSQARIEPTVKAQVPAKETLFELKRYQLELEAENAEYKEVLFYRAQSSPEAIEDIRQYFGGIQRRDLLGGETYLPAFLEWTIWRVFLAINRLSGPVNKTRNFRIDDELNPLHHARSGVADMIFTYDGFVLVVEATLNTSARQWDTEAEPVPRHVADVVGVQEEPTPVYGLFVAPSIDPNTAHTFLRQELMVRGRYQPIQIVPITVGQLESLLVAFANRRFGPEELKALIEELVELKAESKDGLEWLMKVTEHLNTWTLPTKAA
jgi:hypothetical protein